MLLDRKLGTWRYYGVNFAVEVVHWRLVKHLKNRWNVYAYVYPEHRLFSEMGERFMEVPDLPFHGGVTLNQWTYDKDGNVTCKKIGSDYNHVGDDEFENYEDEESAWEVFQDADKLFEALCVV
jgi:hypothetical protein